MQRINLILPVVAAFFAGISFVYSCTGCGDGGSSANGQSSGGNVPAGAIVAFGGATAPQGYLLCDGSPVSRTDFADLFTAIGNGWGEGDGSTTFNLPDLRGRFIRGVDAGAGRDPGADSRTNDVTGGSTGDLVGSMQRDAFGLHNHALTYGNGVNVPVGFVALPNIDNVSGTTTDSIQATGGSETRPINAYVNFIIKI